MLKSMEKWDFCIFILYKGKIITNYKQVLCKSRKSGHIHFNKVLTMNIKSTAVTTHIGISPLVLEAPRQAHPFCCVLPKRR